MKKNILTYFSDTNDGNIAYHVGLSLNNAKQNRILLCDKLSVDESKLIFMEQTHSDNIMIVDKDSETQIKNCDAIITNEYNLPLMVMVADCIPILVYDEVKHIVAAIHSGRNGTFLKILEKTILKMVDHFDSLVCDIQVYFGPSIGFCCYEVSQDMANITETSFGSKFVNNRNIDLLGINLDILEKLGVGKENIIIDKTCTYCDKEGKCFSYRKDKNCGRFCGIICLKEDLDN